MYTYIVWYYLLDKWILYSFGKKIAKEFGEKVYSHINWGAIPLLVTNSDGQQLLNTCCILTTKLVAFKKTCASLSAKSCFEGRAMRTGNQIVWLSDLLCETNTLRGTFLSRKGCLCYLRVNFQSVKHIFPLFVAFFHNFKTPHLCCKNQRQNMP